MTKGLDRKELENFSINRVSQFTVPIAAPELKNYYFKKLKIQELEFK